MPSGWHPADEWLVIVIISAAFGGFVHGISRPAPGRYTLVWPFSGKATEFGVLGDIFVGITAGVAIFFVMDSFFGLKTDKVDPEKILKVAGLGVICGYLGVTLLNQLSLIVFKRIIKDEKEIEQERTQLEMLKKRIQATSKAVDLMSLADAYWRWGQAQKDNTLLDRSLELFDEAIAADPTNPDHYIKKSFVYAEKAATAEDKSLLYDSAIALTNMALKVDESCARAYYDRACYKQLKGGATADVLRDLETAIKHNDVMRKLAKLDPDFKQLREAASFKKLVDSEPTPNASTKIAAVA